MKHLFVISLTILMVSSCGKGEERYKGEYLMVFGTPTPEIKVKFTTRTPFNGQTEFDLDWVRFGDLISTEDDSKMDDIEKDIGRTFLVRTASRNPGVLVEPQPEPDYYRIYFQSGSRLVKLTSPEGSGAHKFSSYPIGPMETAWSFYIKGSEGCKDHASWDIEGKLSKNNLLMQVDYHWSYAAPNLAQDEEANRCRADLNAALAEDDFNPSDPNSKPTSLYQIWYLIIKTRVQNVDPMEMYLQLKSIDFSVQVAGGRKFSAPWN